MSINVDRHGFRNILVDIDALATSRHALDVAFAVAKRFHSRVRVVDCVADVPLRARSFVTTPVEHELIDDRRARLERAVYWRRHAIPVETAVLRGEPVDTLVREVLRSGPDLVIREHGRELADATQVSDSASVRLLRSCPCPVWLVEAEAITPRPHVVAAVDTRTDNPIEHALNREIVDMAQKLREVRGGDLIVAHTWQVHGEQPLQPRMAPHVYADMLLRTERTAYERTAALLVSLEDHVQDARVQIVQGEPQAVLPALVEELHAGVLVMGSRGRRGIAGLLMGNTAEHVARHWPGSIVVVKPLGFVSDRPGAPRAAYSTE